MKAVCRRTGLSPHVLRAWEIRYAVVEPRRSEGRHRLYTEAEVERLVLLAELTRLGHAIGSIARLETATLREMKAATAADATSRTRESMPPLFSTAAALVDSMLAAVQSYRVEQFEAVLDEGAVKLGHSGLMELVLVPLLHRVGDEWQAGRITAAQEHAATQSLKDYIARRMRPMGTPEHAPRLLVATPAGQLHEMGAAIVAGLARKAGWNVTYLGPSLPAEEIVGAALAGDYRAVALSIIYPDDDPEMADQLVRLRSLLPDELPIIVGGRAASGYEAVLRTIGALRVENMEEFTAVLAQIRSGSVSAAPVVASPAVSAPESAAHSH